MRKLFVAAALLCHSAWSLNSGSAQEDGRPGGPGFGGRMMRMNPITVALDADEDGEISEKEIENAVTALKSLDKDKNGRLSRDELRPNFGGPGGPGGPGPGFEGGRPSPEERIARLMESDKNGDGKLSQEEFPAQVQGLLTRADADKDGFATKDELAKMVEQDGAGGAGGPGFGGPGGPGFGGRGGFGGPRNPEAMVDRLFELDADKDGKLTREELGMMTEQFGRGFGGGGRGRDGRPDRPNRPE